MINLHATAAGEGDRAMWDAKRRDHQRKEVNVKRFKDRRRRKIKVCRWRKTEHTEPQWHQEKCLKPGPRCGGEGSQFLTVLSRQLLGWAAVNGRSVAVGMATWTPNRSHAEFFLVLIRCLAQPLLSLPWPQACPHHSTALKKQPLSEPLMGRKHTLSKLVCSTLRFNTGENDAPLRRQCCHLSKTNMSKWKRRWKRWNMLSLERCWFLKKLSWKFITSVSLRLGLVRTVVCHFYWSMYWSSVPKLLNKTISVVATLFYEHRSCHKTTFIPVSAGQYSLIYTAICLCNQHQERCFLLENVIYLK